MERAIVASGCAMGWAIVASGRAMGRAILASGHALVHAIVRRRCGAPKTPAKCAPLLDPTPSPNLCMAAPYGALGMGQ